MQKCVIFDARFELNISTGTAVFYVPTFMFFLFNIDRSNLAFCLPSPINFTE